MIQQRWHVHLLFPSAALHSSGGSARPPGSCTPPPAALAAAPLPQPPSSLPARRAALRPPPPPHPPAGPQVHAPRAAAGQPLRLDPGGLLPRPLLWWVLLPPHGALTLPGVCHFTRGLSLYPGYVSWLCFDPPGVASVVQRMHGAVPRTRMLCCRPRGTLPHTPTPPHPHTPTPPLSCCCRLPRRAV